MVTYIALFRGINVGGRNTLPMKDLVALLEGLGCDDVTTYIQSGNAVFRHDEVDSPHLAARISTSICESHGFKPDVLLLTTEQLERAVASNPFPDAESEPSRLHVFFLAAAPDNPDTDRMEEMRAENERVAVQSGVVYFHAPDGIGRSKLAAGLERALGVAGTGVRLPRFWIWPGSRFRVAAAFDPQGNRIAHLMWGDQAKTLGSVEITQPGPGYVDHTCGNLFQLYRV